MKDAINFCRELLAFWGDNLDAVITQMRAEFFSEAQITSALAVLCSEVPFGG